MNFMLEVTDYTQPVSNFMDRLTFGGLMVLIGMLVIFSVLIIIWGCLVLFKLCFAGKEEKAVKPQAPAPLPVVEAKSDDGEIIAAIAAAIAMAESESSGLKFKVVSFRRK